MSTSALLDLAVDEAEEIERLVELHQVGVHQHEVADRHRAGAHAAAPPSASPPRGRCAMIAAWPMLSMFSVHLDCAPRRARSAPARSSKRARLVRLVAEILDGLVVQQAVDRLGLRLGVGLVHGAAEAHAPVGEARA